MNQPDWIRKNLRDAECICLNIQIPDCLRMGMDELSAGIHRITHQHVECAVGLSRVLHRDEDQGAVLGVHRRLPKERMKKLAEHIRLAHEDAGQVQITSKKISEKFAAIERAELPGAIEQPSVPDGNPPQLTVVPKPE